MGTGSWDQIRQIRRPKHPKQSRLRNQSGAIVDSDEWADTMAAHMETMQWRVWFVDATDGISPHGVSPVDLTQLFDAEVTQVVKRLRHNRASGPDDIPAEY